MVGWEGRGDQWVTSDKRVPRADVGSGGGGEDEGGLCRSKCDARLVQRWVEEEEEEEEQEEE